MTACPRCQIGLVEDDEHDLVCPSGCGRWITAATIVNLLGTNDLAKLARPIGDVKPKPFPTAICPTCAVRLADQYMALPDGSVLTLGYCGQHGAWLDHGTRADFAAAYGKAITARTAAKAEPRSWGQVDRVTALEERVAELERLIATLMTDKT